MLNHKNKGVLLLASSLLFTIAAQPVFAVGVAKMVTLKPVPVVATKLKPQKITSKLMLASLLMTHKTNRYNPLYTMKDGGTMSTALPTTPPGTTPVSHSDTNIQVSGVDESDSVKVGDDGYIYQIHNNQIRIIKGFPIVELSQTATIEFPDSHFYPTGIYIQNGKLAVLGSSWQDLIQPQKFNPTGKMAIWGGGYSQISQTRVLIYDVTDHANPKQVRDVSVDGDYLDSRRIGDDLYLVSRTYPRYYMDDGIINPFNAKIADMLPSIVDTKKGKTTTRTMSINDLYYFPKFVEPDYVVVTSLNLAKSDKAISTKAYMGAGELVYASMQNLYLSASKYNFTNFNGGVVFNAAAGIKATDTSIVAPEPIITDTTSTQIFKFGIDKGAVSFTAAGEVAGTALNQFSMDENGDYFRIATTTQNWNSGTNQSHNSLFVLDKNMKTVGKLENLAKGEQIYSTRFLGNRGYIVTFRLTDPLFVIDLSIPEKPMVMGELKIPGYSNYLHPYDETHLIGFGKDAAVYTSEQANSDQFWAGGSAFYQGLKIALFDVTDMKNPNEIHSVTIGDRGTDSPLLWDHKALYWDAEKHLFGFPVQLSINPKGFDKTQPWLYGQPTYQGAYIYEVTPEKGFTLKAKLSQIPADILPVQYEYGSYWDSDASNFFVDRILRIENNLYTLSNDQLNAYELENFKEQGKLAFKP